MIEVNKPMMINEKQHQAMKIQYRGIIATRIDDNGQHWMKPMCFLGFKQDIEATLNKLL